LSAAKAGVIPGPTVMVTAINIASIFLGREQSGFAMNISCVVRVEVNRRRGRGSARRNSGRSEFEIGPFIVGEAVLPRD